MSWEDRVYSVLDRSFLHGLLYWLSVPFLVFLFYVRREKVVVSQAYLWLTPEQRSLIAGCSFFSDDCCLLQNGKLCNVVSFPAKACFRVTDGL